MALCTDKPLQDAVGTPIPMSLSLQPDSQTFLNEVLTALKYYESREALVRHACGEGTLDGFRNAFDAFIHATQLVIASPTLQSRENMQDEPAVRSPSRINTPS